MFSKSIALQKATLKELKIPLGFEELNYKFKTCYQKKKKIKKNKDV